MTITKEAALKALPEWRSTICQHECAEELLGGARCKSCACGEPEPMDFDGRAASIREAGKE